MNLLLPYNDRIEKIVDGSVAVIKRIDAGLQSSKERYDEYGLRCAHAEQLKTELRYKRYNEFKSQDLSKLDFNKDKILAWEFWAEYEDINRRLLPEDPVYSGTRGGVALSTTADHFTYTSGASGQARLLEFSIQGEATASAVNRVGIYNSSSGATPTNQTMEKFSTRSPAAAGTYATAWSTAPTLNANPVMWFAFNAFGGGDKWIASPGAELYVVNGEKFSGRSASGTSTVSSYIIVEEL